MKKGVFGFCDEAGSHAVSLATGKQSVGTRTCDPKHEVVQSSCDDAVTISGSTEGGNDILEMDGQGYVLHGHDHACDRDGKVIIAGTVGAVEVIDRAVNKVCHRRSKRRGRAVIGSGWVAWSPLGDKGSLRLETLAKALEHAATPK